MKIDKNYLYSGGLAEFLSQPTKLTFSFFRHWFTGKKSVGKAMNLLKLPYLPLSSPLLVLINEEIYVNLKIEEETLYHDTVFHYKPQKSIHDKPQQAFSFSKILLPDSWNGTFQHINQQSYWLGHADEVKKFATDLIESIPDNPTQQSVEEIDDYISETVWPAVIAISVINEFFLAVAEKDHSLQKQSIQDEMNRQIIEKDWFFLSLRKMHDVKAGAMTFEDFIRQYGLRADKDYELSCPRWLEIPEQIKLRIKDLGDLTEIKRSQPSTVLPALAQTVVDIQLARIRIKQKALAYMYHLRLELLSKYKKDDLADYTRSLILYGKNENIVSEHINIDEQVLHKTVKETGKGNGVSQGISKGVTQHISDATETIHEGAICIFPNTSPEFSPFYKRCNAIIFMKGGVTSHGAIVAREYGIPAIVYNQIEEIPQNTSVEVDGMKGTWKVV